MSCIILWLALVRCAFGSSHHLPYFNPSTFASSNDKLLHTEAVTGDNNKINGQNYSIISLEPPEHIRNNTSNRKFHDFLQNSSTIDYNLVNDSYKLSVPSVIFTRTTAVPSENYNSQDSYSSVHRHPIYYESIPPKHQASLVHDQLSFPQSFVLNSGSINRQSADGTYFLPAFTMGNDSRVEAHTTANNHLSTYSSPISTGVSINSGYPQGTTYVTSPTIGLKSTNQADFLRFTNQSQNPIKTNKYVVRRPAIKKDFYDIEERIIVRPAGSIVLELDHPISQTPKSKTIKELEESQYSDIEKNQSSEAILNLNIGTPSMYGIITKDYQEKKVSSNGNESNDTSGFDELDGLPPKVADSSTYRTTTSETLTTRKIPVTVSKLTSILKTTSMPYIVNESVSDESKLKTPNNENKKHNSEDYPINHPQIRYDRHGLKNFIQYQSKDTSPQPVECDSVCQERAKNNYQQNPRNHSPFVYNHYTHMDYNNPSHQSNFQQNGFYSHSQNPQHLDEYKINNYHQFKEPKISKYTQKNIYPYYPQHSQQNYHHDEQFYPSEQDYKTRSTEYYGKAGMIKNPLNQYERQNIEQQAYITEVHSDWNPYNNSVPYMMAIGEPDFTNPPFVETVSNFDPKSSKKIGELKVHTGEDHFQRFRLNPFETRPEEQYEMKYAGMNSRTQDSSTQDAAENQRKYLKLMFPSRDTFEISEKLLQPQASKNYLRSRIISATPGESSPLTGEQVLTSRIIVSHPLETVQEVEIQEPSTDYERVVQYKAGVGETFLPIYKRPMLVSHPDTAPHFKM